MKGLLQTLAGAAMIAAGILVEIGTLGGGTPLATFLISAGSGMMLSGIGTMLTKGPLQGMETATRNPVAPWNVVYGRKRVGGTVVDLNSFGDNDKYLDMVLTVACHSCQSVDALLFDNQKIFIGAGNTSFTPAAQDIVIYDIARTESTVTVILHSDIPNLGDGDQVLIKDVPGDLTFNGKWNVADVVHGSGTLTFTYTCGGPASHVTNAGHCLTAWADYGKKVYMEVMLGGQSLGTTFTGMGSSGTTDDGVPGTTVKPDANPWVANCSQVGKTAVFLRLHYNDKVFANGLPQISFLVHGKNDIYDPRTGTSGYTENAALCIADYLSNTTWGFKAAYHTEIPDDPLIAAADLCDEEVSLASGATEKRYTCNGGFPLTMRRGEVLQNLLTACAGRLTYVGGQFVIWPAAWRDPASDAAITGTQIYSLLTGTFRWRSKVSASNLYNGVKGTYVSPANNWQSADFPRYAQDVIHGYSSDANLAFDGGERRWLDIQLPFTISSATAQRLAKIELMRRRQQGTGTFPLNMAAYQYAPMDVIPMDLDYLGWTGKYLEVLDSRLKFDKQSDGSNEVTLLGVEIDVQETDPSVYAWDIGEELSPAGYQQVDVGDNRTPAGPTNVLLESFAGAIFVTWTPPADAFVQHGGHVELQYQKVESPEGLWLTTGRLKPDTQQSIIPNLTEGDQYTVEVRGVNAAGVPSDWVEGSPIESSPLAPGPVTVVGGGGGTGTAGYRPVPVDDSSDDPFLLTPGNQIVSLLATSADHVIVLPSEAADIGDNVIIKNSAISTKDGIRRVHSVSGVDDTVDGSSEDFHITPGSAWSGIGM